MTISQTMRMEDRVSPVLKSISKSAQEVMERYKRLDDEQTKLIQTSVQIAQEYGRENEMYKKLSKSIEEYSEKIKKLVQTGQYSENGPWYEQNKFYQQWKSNQENVTNEVSATEAALRRVGALIKTVVGVYSIRQLMNMSDQMVQVEARLGLANKGGDSTEQFSNKIFQAAQRSRADYNTMASTIAKLGMQAGDAFGNNDELIKFAENLNKIFVTSGLDAGGIQSVMYNLTQSMSTGRLLGNDYRILKMNAPELVKLLRDTYANGSQEALDEMVTKGKISAQMLKDAIVKNTDAIEEKFNKMPVTWEQVFTSIKNTTQRLLKPVLKIVSNIAGSVYTLTESIEQNWDTIAPILTNLAAAIGLVGFAWVAAKLIAIPAKLAMRIAAYKDAAAYLIEAEAAKAAGKAMDYNSVAAAKNTVAQGNLTLAMAKFIAIAALVVVAVIGAANLFSWAYEKITGEHMSALGLIIGSIFVIGAAIWNFIVGIINAIYMKIASIVDPIIGVVEWILNVCNGGFESFGDAVANLIGNIISWFLGLGKVVTTIIDAIFGTNWTEGLTSLQHSVQSWGKKNENAITLDRMGDTQPLDRLNYYGNGGVFYRGYKIGNDIQDGISNAFKGADEDILGSVLGSDGQGGSAIKTTSNDKLLDEEDIQLLLDVATRDYKLNYQHITPEVTVTFGDVRETADVDAVLERVVTTLEEAASGDLGMVTA